MTFGFLSAGKGCQAFNVNACDAGISQKEIALDCATVLSGAIH